VKLGLRGVACAGQFVLPIRAVYPNSVWSADMLHASGSYKALLSPLMQ